MQRRTIGTVLALSVLAVAAPCAHYSTRHKLENALFGIDAPLGPRSGPVQKMDCTFRDENMSDDELRSVAHDRCYTLVREACASLERAVIDQIVTIVPRCLDRIPGCNTRSRAIPGHRVEFRCLSGPRSRFDPWRDDPVTQLDEAEP